MPAAWASRGSRHPRWSPAADNVFRTLLTAPRPARFYALAWLQHSRPDAYRRLAAQELAEGGVVRTMSGCVMWDAPVREVLDDMNRGEWTRDLSFGRPIQLISTER